MNPLRQLFLGVFCLFLAAAPGLKAAEDRDSKVRRDRDEVVSTGLWTYNDLGKGIAEAKRTGKPLLVVFRCIP